jgi:hypothetical protein
VVVGSHFCNVGLKLTFGEHNKTFPFEYSPHVFFYLSGPACHLPYSTQSYVPDITVRPHCNPVTFECSENVGVMSSYSTTSDSWQSYYISMGLLNK